MRLVLPVLVLLSLLIAATALASTPYEISYQGVLRDNAGELVSDGAYDIHFLLYTVQTGGAPVWSDTMNVAVDNGVFNVRLGSEQHLYYVDFDSYLWLEMEVEGEAPLSPRTQLTAAPYAMMAVDTQFDVVESIDGVTNDEGDIDLVEGANITITPNDSANTITISADAAADDDWTIDGDDVYKLDGSVGVGIEPSVARLEVEGDYEMLHLRTNVMDSGDVVEFNVNNYGTLRVETPDTNGRIILAPDGREALMAYAGPIGHRGVAIGGSFSGETSYELQVLGTSLLGTVEIRDGAGEGKVLTSDADGVASWQDPPGGSSTIVDTDDEGSTTNIGSSWTQYGNMQISLTVPGPGYIEVTSSVWIRLNHTTGTQDLCEFGISEAPTSGPSSYSKQVIEIHSGFVSDASYDESRTPTDTFFVASAGTYTYYLVGRMVYGQGTGDNFWYAHMRGVYHPASAVAVAGAIAEREAAEERMRALGK